jgi:hypothetical protein
LRVTHEHFAADRRSVVVEVVRDQQSVPPRTRRRWLRIFLGGLALWVATVVVIFDALIPVPPSRYGTGR